MVKGRESRSNKRKFGGSWNSGGGGPNPRRGPPAIFFTCESFREKKCQREAFELIHHYYYQIVKGVSSQGNGNSSDNDDDKQPDSNNKKRTSSADGQPLSLEVELSMLRKGAAAEAVLTYEPNNSNKRSRGDGGAGGGSNPTRKQVSSMKSPFSVFDTGARGVVCILCTLSGCELVPYDQILADIKATKETSSVKANSKSDGNRNTTTTAIVNPPWDPVNTVKCILRDAKLLNKKSCNDNDDSPTNTKEDHDQEDKANNDATKELLASPPPGSRFISRLLPMQATCFASVEEVKAVSTSLLKQILPNTPALLAMKDREISFKVDIKRRLCSHMKRDELIEAITPVVLGGLEEMPGYNFRVNLTDPDFSIRIETCKSLCGVSVLPREEWHKNFNLSVLTTKVADS